eukprot:TRINITY_DN5885_c0_g1_i1.p1 TRINITY_DN5885_c0_g1~~TRINITY_DN5885_c0_g1_i1.p1  ORF type:complete len:348 (+),score=94.71 TRINITY_DN5885_c0_g1_i1:96-1139(+)
MENGYRIVLTPDDTRKSFHLKEDKVRVVGVAIKEGQDHEGPEKAPQELRKAGLEKIVNKTGWLLQDLGDITLENIDKLLKELPPLRDAAPRGKIKVKNGQTIGKVCKALHLMAKEAAQSGEFFLTLGGDHGIATGSITGLLAAYPDLRVIWVDAHGDINTPSISPSGNYHGMPVAHMINLFNNVAGFEWLATHLPKENFVFIGLRDVDPLEKEVIRKNKVKYFSMDEVEEFGIGKVMDQALSYLDPEGKNFPIHVSWDVDGIDPQFAPGTGTRARGGLTYRESHYILRRLASTKNLVGMDLVEINPDLEPKKETREVLHGDDPDIVGTQTVALGLELIRSALGHKLV